MLCMMMDLLICDYNHYVFHLGRILSVDYKQCDVASDEHCEFVVSLAFYSQDDGKKLTVARGPVRRVRLLGPYSGGLLNVEIDRRLRAFVFAQSSAAPGLLHMHCTAIGKSCTMELRSPFPDPNAQRKAKPGQHVVLVAPNFV